MQTSRKAAFAPGLLKSGSSSGSLTGSRCLLHRWKHSRMEHGPATPPSEACYVFCSSSPGHKLSNQVLFGVIAGGVYCGNTVPAITKGSGSFHAKSAPFWPVNVHLHPSRVRGGSLSETALASSSSVEGRFHERSSSLECVSGGAPLRQRPCFNGPEG